MTRLILRMGLQGRPVPCLPEVTTAGAWRKQSSTHAGTDGQMV